MDKLCYLVSVPKGPLYYCTNKIRNYLWNKYNLGNGIKPELHLTIDAFSYTSEEELSNIIDELKNITINCEPFEINSNGFSFIPHPYNCITVHIVKNDSIKNLYCKIHSTMKNKGFKVREFSAEEIVFHISIAGIHGRELSEKEMKKIWEEVSKFNINEISLLDELQLWFSEVYDPHLRLIESFKFNNSY